MAKQTGQTGQQAALAKTPFFEVAKDDEGKWQWCLWSTNGRQVLRSGGSFSLVKDAINSIKAARVAMAQAGPVIRTDHDELIEAED